MCLTSQAEDDFGRNPYIDEASIHASLLNTGYREQNTFARLVIIRTGISARCPRWYAPAQIELP